MSDNNKLDLGGCTPDQLAQVTEVLHGDTAAALALCHVFATRDRTEEVAFGLNTVFLIFSGALVFIMHGGFAMLEAGAIRSKNAMNILLQTILDGAASAVMWYLVGFGFAYGVGDDPNGFIGDALFGLARYSSHPTGTGLGNWTNWFYQWAFCATAATIPAGAVAERFNFNAYLGYSLFLGGFVYPVVVHWVWCPTGWLGYGNNDPLLNTGMIDFAGSGVVHMVGGLAGLLGAWMVGPRLGRFDADGRPVPMPGHSAILVVLGTVLLWFGWYGFNPGSALIVDHVNSATIAGRTAVTTTLSGAAGGLMCLFIAFARQVAWDLISLCNGMLVGFVAITAGCHVVEPWAALLCGCCAACVFEAMCALLLRLRVDDVVSAGPMHGFCGAFGVLFVGLLAKEEYVRQAYIREDYPYGLFYGGGGKLLASQAIGALAIGGWVIGTMGLFFLAFKMAGALRINPVEEFAGLDVSRHGGSAYNNHGTHYGGCANIEALQLQLQMAGAGTAAPLNPLAQPAAQPHIVVPPSGAVRGGGGNKAVGDAIMRCVTIGFAGSSHHQGANPSGHFFAGSQHSHGSAALMSTGGIALGAFGAAAAAAAQGGALYGGNGAVGGISPMLALTAASAAGGGGGDVGGPNGDGTSAGKEFGGARQTDGSNGDGNRSGSGSHGSGSASGGSRGNGGGGGAEFVSADVMLVNVSAGPQPSGHPSMMAPTATAAATATAVAAAAATTAVAKVAALSAAAPAGAEPAAGTSRGLGTGALSLELARRSDGGDGGGGQALQQ